MEVIIAKDYETLSRQAIIIAAQIIGRPDSVLGWLLVPLPVGTYKHLVALYREGIIDFSRVKTFNLDEYYGVALTIPAAIAGLWRKTS